MPHAESYVHMYRERKKAHLDMLQQKVSLLEKTNCTLSEQLGLREAEVRQLKSRLGDVTGQLSSANCCVCLLRCLPGQQQEQCLRKLYCNPHNLLHCIACQHCTLKHSLLRQR